MSARTPIPDLASMKARAAQHQLPRRGDMSALLRYADALAGALRDCLAAMDAHNDFVRDAHHGYSVAVPDVRALLPEPSS